VVVGCGAKTGIATDASTDHSESRGDATPSNPEAICPDAIATTPLATVELTGIGVDDGSALSYRWALLEKPPGSASGPPSPDTDRTTTFTPDVAGDYTLELSVTDDDGHTASCRVLIRALPDEGLRVEMYWNGPPDRSCDTYAGLDCDPSDLDLHLLRPGSERWFDSVGDCHWVNCAPGRTVDWGTAGDPTDNPRLDLDDQEGFGPENINVDVPVPGVYRLAVDFWGHDGRRDAAVVVSIYCGASRAGPAATFGPVTLRADGPTPAFDFWRVADIGVAGESCVINDLSVDGRPNIIRHNDARATR
jgi:hypothetical protein